MGMERHEVPTVFVHGSAPPDEVAYADQRLQAVLFESTRMVRYAVLMIAADATAGVEVEIEVGFSKEPLCVRAVAATVADATDACLDQIIEDLTRTFV